ncbi:MAG: GNAT family N-acetyltransferase [Clostridia bacterium]|nr:GNAT family N-acetyltransferase [Clostridia bacterium]
MNHILDLRGLLHRSDVRSLFAESLYRPTKSRLDRWIVSLTGDMDVYAYGFLEKDTLVGVLAARRNLLQEKKLEMEILAIAVDPAFRGQGVGRELIQAVTRMHEPYQIVAETDADAVAFYRRCGFQVKSLGEKYPGVVRYRCEWRGEERQSTGG